MTQDIYADLLFLINFSMDYLCLYVCAKVLHRRMNLWRMIIGAAAGGIYSVISLFFPFSAPVNLVIDAIFCFLICLIAYHEKKRRFSQLFTDTFLFIGISLMTGGVMTATFNLLNKLNLPLDDIDSDGLSTYLFAIVAAVAGFISLGSGKIISQRANIRECHVTLTLCGKTLTLLAMSDSGNLVKDPLSGKSVIIIERKELSKLCDVTLFDSFLRGEMPENEHSIKGLRIIPINTAGGRGFLCAALPENLTVEITSTKGKVSVVSPDALISPGDIGESAEGYRAIIPSEIIKI